MTLPPRRPLPSSQNSIWHSIKSAVNGLRGDTYAAEKHGETQNLYDTTDDWDAANLLGRAYTIYHPLEPRALIWYFLIAVPIIIAVIVAFIDQSLVLLFKLKHDYIGKYLSDWVGQDAGKLILCGIGWGALTSTLLGISYLLSRKFAHGTSGRGMPRVMASLNGVYMPHWGHFRILVCKILSVVITVISGVPYDFVGTINEIGAMVGACSMSRHPFYQRIVPFAKYFRNHRDARLIVAVGIATAATAAFKSPIGGLALLLELSAVKFNIKFLYRVFLSCCVCGFVGQLIYTHIYGFETRETTGGWEMAPLQQLAQIPENLLVVVPAVVLGIMGGLFQGIFAIMSNFILARPSLRTIQALLVVAFIYGFTVFTVAGAFGFTGECRLFNQTNDSFILEGTPVFLHSKMFCDQNPFANSDNASVPPSPPPMIYGTNETMPYINAFGSLTLGFDSSILRTMFRRRVASFWTIPELAAAAAILSAVLPFLTVLSLVDGDVLMPTGLLGGCIGHLFYFLAAHFEFNHPWYDGGLFALLGAVSFISGMTRFTFSLVFLFVDFAGDVRHVLFIMLAVSVARAVADRVAPVRIDYVVMKHQGFPILDFTKIEQYDTVSLHRFESKNLKVIPPTCTVAQLVRLLARTFHNSFPVIDPQSQRFIGLVHRRTLLLIVWGFSKNIPVAFQHPATGWAGRITEGTSTAQITRHAFAASAGGVTHSSAILSFKIANPTVHLPRGQYESFFSDEQLARGNRHHIPAATNNQHNNQNSQNTTSGAVKVEGGNALGTIFASPRTQMNNNNNNNNNTVNEEKEATLRKMLEDYDHFDAHDAAEEFYRLRDLDDWLHVEFAEDDATLFQNARGIKTQRTVMHGAFIDETLKFDDATLNTQINLVRYADRASYTVRAAMCISRLYNMFTVLGLRNAVILDYNNRPTGVITRRDLMTYQILKKKQQQDEEDMKAGGIMTTPYSEAGKTGDFYDDEYEGDNDVPISRGASVSSFDVVPEPQNIHGIRKPSVASKKNAAGVGAMSYNKGVANAAGRFYDNDANTVKRNFDNNDDDSSSNTSRSSSLQNNNNNNKNTSKTVSGTNKVGKPNSPNTATAPSTTHNSPAGTAQNTKTSFAPSNSATSKPASPPPTANAKTPAANGAPTTAATTTTTKENQNYTKESDTISLLAESSVASHHQAPPPRPDHSPDESMSTGGDGAASQSSATSSTAKKKDDEDAFKGRILYTVNRMRPLMLLPKGWNGSGQTRTALFSSGNQNNKNGDYGSTHHHAPTKNNNNNNNVGSQSPTQRVAEKRYTYNDDDEEDEDEDVKSNASYTTIVSDPGN